MQILNLTLPNERDSRRRLYRRIIEASDDVVLNRTAFWMMPWLTDPDYDLGYIPTSWQGREPDSDMLADAIREIALDDLRWAYGDRPRYGYTYSRPEHLRPPRHDGVPDSNGVWHFYRTRSEARIVTAVFDTHHMACDDRRLVELMQQHPLNLLRALELFEDGDLNDADEFPIESDVPPEVTSTVNVTSDDALITARRLISTQASQRLVNEAWGDLMATSASNETPRFTIGSTRAGSHIDGSIRYWTDTTDATINLLTEQHLNGLDPTR